MESPKINQVIFGKISQRRYGLKNIECLNLSNKILNKLRNYNQNTNSI